MVATQKVHIVGIGASAGGLEAITQLIGQLTPELPCAYVVLQHLSPTHRSMMVDILARETRLPVKAVGQGDRPEAGTIHVVPANHNALLKDGCFQLHVAPPEVVPKPSVNQFLISLAAEEGEAAIGIVLSGTGSDGTAGLRAVQAAGGFTLVQAPESAKYDGMPRAAIDAGVVDHILPPEAMAKRLQELLEVPDTRAAAEPPPDLVERLLSLLKDRLHFDFSGYKVGMLMRRIRRREVATGQPDLSSYLSWVEHNPAELELLAKDILISVTAFFRDREAFGALQALVTDLCKRKASGQETRVWVAGCASGEEAYSIAMMFADALGERLGQTRIQIFATDIDEEALNVARRGVYPAAALTELSPDVLQRHFKPLKHSYEVAKHLRDMIVFARHNLVSDPPFLRLDLVTCRNVLIYFDSALQSKVLQTFHFGLGKGGVLFLGRSESVAHAEQLFAPLDRRERLFRKVGDSTAMPGPASMPPMRSPMQRRDHKVEVLLTGLVSHFNAFVALCDAEGNVQHSAGAVERYLQFPTGAARLSISDAVVPSLRGELLALLHRCQRTGKAQSGRTRRLGDESIQLHVKPLADGTETLLLVLVSPITASQAEPPDVPPNVEMDMEDELVATREHLQTLVEEMATANEEMQALNEEAQASNEELQATNEELEAANEELQATNEELVSLNEELNTKTLQVSQLSAEYAHLYDALQFPILVFNCNSELIRFNAPAALRFELRTTALHQPVQRLKLPSAMVNLEATLGRVLAHGERDECVVEQDGRHLRLSVTPGLDPAGQVATLVVTLFDVTDIMQAQADLSASQMRLAALMENTSMIFAMKDISGVYLYANQRFLEFFGVAADSYMGQTDFSLLPQALAADLWGMDVSALRQRMPVSGEHALPGPDGQRHLRSVHQALFDDSGHPTAIIMEAEDITATKHAEEQLRITARVFDQAGEAIVVTDPAGRIQTVNSAFTTISGYSATEAIGQPTTLLKSGRHSPDFYQSMWQALTDTGFWQGEICNRRKNGELYPEWLTINAVKNDLGQIEHYVAVFSDISQIKDSQRKAEYLATHDALTGLPNRSLFHDRLRHALAMARRSKQRVGALFIDLDNFKTINDTLGHDVGDALLKECAARLREVVRDVDTVARMGGDEFTALLVDCNPEAAAQVAHRLVDELSSSFEIGGRKLFASASIGVAFFPDDGQDSAELIKAADAAMYRAKEQGRNRVEFFKPDLQVRLLKRATLESALREALRNKRLRLVFQPKYALTEPQHLVGAEALLRWTDPELGVISPAEFIPVAEGCGLIGEVDRAAHHLLIEHLRSWLDLGLRPPCVAFNVSPRSIRDVQFVTRLLSAIDEASIDHGLLQVEITESALIENSSVVVNNIAALEAAGLHIAIDDFGTGYSSLGYLKRMPITELKIDKSFVDGLGSDREDEAITRAVLGLANALEVRTVAEGVETATQLMWLKDMGCHIGQGYLLSKPMEALDFEDFIARHPSDPAHDTGLPGPM